MTRGMVVAALALTLTLAGGAQAGPPSRTYVQLNICGNACNSGGLGVIAELVRSVRARGPSVVTLNEICQNQYDRLQTDLAGYRGHFDPTGPRCRNGARYGNAVLVRTAGGLDLVGSWELPSPAGHEARRLLCVRARSVAPAGLVACVTHISNVSGNIAAQVRSVANILSGLDRDGAVLLGGDFNTVPDDPRMDPLRSGWSGASAPGEPTYSRYRYDYVLLADGYWAPATTEVTDALHGLSDHRALWATAVPRPAGGQAR